MPVGVEAVPELMCTPDQREYIYHKLRDYRSRKPLFAMDFQNDAEYVEGCIAGGRRYLHINANGDVEPCVFIHYSDSNIRKKTLLETLTSPMCMAYHDGQPFNKKHDETLPYAGKSGDPPEMVKQAGAHSTDLQASERQSISVPSVSSMRPIGPLRRKAVGGKCRRKKQLERKRTFGIIPTKERLMEAFQKIILSRTSCYLLKTAEGYLLVDCGCAGDERPLLSKLRRIGITPASIRYLLLTHTSQRSLRLLPFLLSVNPQIKIIMSETCAGDLETGRHFHPAAERYACKALGFAMGIYGLAGGKLTDTFPPYSNARAMC